MKFFAKKQTSKKNDNSLNETLLSYRNALLKLVGNIAPSAEVEDIVQDAYVKVFQINSDNKPINYPKALIYKIARNLAYDYNKKSEVKLSDSVEQESDYGVSDKDGTYEQVLVDGEFSNFCEAVRHLPPQCRKVFVLRKIYGFTQKEIAKELDLSQYTVENHTAYGMLKCNEFLKQKLNDKQKKVLISSAEFDLRSKQL